MYAGKAEMKGGGERKDNDESGKISETRHWVKVKWRLRIGMGQRQRRDKSRLSTVYMYENEAIGPQRQSQQRSIMSRFLSNDRTNRSVEEKLAEVSNMRLPSWVASFCLTLRNPALPRPNPLSSVQIVLISKAKNKISSLI